MPPMRTSAEVDPTSRTSWWAHHSHRYLLPAIGGAALAAGIGSALLGPVRVAIPPAGILALLGASSLSASMITTALRIRLQSDWAAPATQPAPTAAAPTCSVCAAPAESH